MRQGFRFGAGVALASAMAATTLTGVANAYVDGPPTLCKFYQARSTVTGTYASAETLSVSCLYDFQREATVAYVTIWLRGSSSNDDYVLTGCSVGWAARDSRGSTITTGSTTIPGPMVGTALVDWTFPVWRYSSLADITLTSVTCNRAPEPQGMFRANLVTTAGNSTRYGQSLYITPVSLRNPSEDTIDVDGRIVMRKGYQSMGVANVTGAGCDSRPLRFQPGETKTCYFVRPSFTANSLYPFEPDTFRFQGTKQILPPTVVTYPTVRGTAKLRRVLTGTKATLVGDTWGYVNWYRCTRPVTSPGVGEPPSYCTSMGESVKLTYRVRPEDAGKYLLMKDNQMNLAAEMDTYSRTVGPIRR